MNLAELNKHYNKLQKIIKLKEMYEILYAKSLGCQKIDGMPHGSGVGDKVAILAIELADIKSRLEYLQQDVKDSQYSIENFLQTVDDDTIRLALRLRYLYGYNWYEVADLYGGGHTADTIKVSCYRYLSNIK